MKPLRTAFNIKGNRPTGSGITMSEYYKVTQAPWGLVLDGNSTGHAIRSQSAYKTNVINRSYDPNDHGRWMYGHPNYKTPQQYAEMHRAKPTDHWIYFPNEPTAKRHGNETEIEIETRALCSWLVNVGQILVNEGRRVVLGNFPVGYPELEHVQKGYFDELIQFCVAHRDHVVLGLHEYALAAIPFGQWNMPDLMDKANWGFDPPRDIDSATQNFPFPDTWHIGRCHWLQWRARSKFKSTIRIVLTEYGIDRLPDVQHIAELLEGKYGNGRHPQHPEIRFPHLQGFYTYAHIYREVYSHLYEGGYPSTGTAKVIYEQLLWGEKFYPDWVEGMLLFMVGKENKNDFEKPGGQWDYKGFNIGADEELLRLMMQGLPEEREEPKPEPPVIIVEPEPKPEPEPMPEPPDMTDDERDTADIVLPTWFKARIWATDYVGFKTTRIRSMSDRKKVIGYIEVGYENPVGDQFGGVEGFIRRETLRDIWVNVKIGDLTGYSHTDWIDWELIKPVPEMPPANGPTDIIDLTPIPPSTIIGSRELRGWLAKMQNWMSTLPGVTDEQSTALKLFAVYIEKVETEDDQNGSE